jgi:predicted neutral ceramidase superfamily lipid hydrolase
MLYYAIKILVSAVLIAAISEIAKRSSGLAALLAAVPLTSLLAFIWLHIEGSPGNDVADLSIQIFWLVIPSLLLFLLLPLMLRHGWNFWLSLALSMMATAGFYLTLLPLLRRMGVQL